MKKILLVPALNTSGRRLLPYMPVGLISLQAVAAEFSNEIDVFYFEDELSSVMLADSEELAQLVFKNINLDEYDAIGFSCVCNAFHHAIRLSELIKEKKPDIQIWIGGPHATAVYEKVLDEFAEIDAIFVGEGEDIMREVLTRRSQGNANLAGIPGIIVRGESYTERKPIENLDNLPFMHSAKDFEKYINMPEMKDHTGEIAEIPIEAARGCPCRCSFCSTRLFWGEKVRYKTNDRIFAEMQKLHEITGCHKFSFRGDNFAGMRKNFLGFCEYMIEKDSGFKWRAELRLNTVKEEDLEILKKAGCWGFFAGIESASQETLNRIKKSINLEREMPLIQKAIDLGFIVETSLIIGYPWETKEDIDKTCELHEKFLQMGAFRSRIWVLCPLPGTDMVKEFPVNYDNVRSAIVFDDLPLNKNFEDKIRNNKDIFVQFGYYETPNLTRADLAGTIYRASKVNVEYARKNL